MSPQDDSLPSSVSVKPADKVTSADLSKRYPAGSVERRNIELQQAYFSAGRRGDWDAVAGFLTPDFALTESPVLPFKGIWRGVQGLKDLRARINGNLIDTVRNDIYEILAGGDFVVALMHLYARGEGDSEIQLKISESFHWVDGKLKAATPYWFDPIALERAVEAKRKRDSG